MASSLLFWGVIGSGSVFKNQPSALDSGSSSVAKQAD